MGKRLIINGADFSTNGINEPLVSSLEIEQGGINITDSHSGNDFGRFSADLNDANRQKRIASEVVEVPLGASIKLSGVAGLRLDYCFYSQTFDMFTEYTITSITTGASEPHPYMQGSASNKNASQYFPINTNGDNTVTVVNNTGYKYIAFSFAALNKTDAISADNFDITFKIV